MDNSHGVEIDLIIDRGTTKEFIEIKHSATFRPKMLEPIESIIQSKDKGHLIYQGKPISYDHNLDAIHYETYLDSLTD